MTQGWIRPHGCIQLPANCSASAASWHSLTECLNLMGQRCLHRHCATTTSGSTSKLQVTSSWLFMFEAAVSKEKKEPISSLCSYAEHLTCGRAADCLIAHVVQSVPPLSPILTFVIATCTSRKSLSLLWIHQDLLLNHLCKLSLEKTSAPQAHPCVPRSAFP